jgi:Protein of unknown function (DUF1580)
MSILQESLLSLHDAAQLLPSSRVGKRVNFSTIWRWALRGVRATDGRRVKLEAARVGGRWLTSREALERFASALTPTNDAEPIRTPTARKKGNAVAKKKLEKMGI